MWKFVERACVVLGVFFAGGCFYVEWAPHAGWWLPTPSASAPTAGAEMHVSMTTWVLGAFYILGVALLLTGATMAFVRLQVARVAQKDKTPAVVVERDTLLGDAVAYMVTGKFDRNAAWENEVGAISGMGAALEEFHQAARDGKLHVWGMPKMWGVHDPIPADYWSSHSVNFMALFREQADVETDGSPEPHYHDIRVSRAEFEKLRPR